MPELTLSPQSGTMNLTTVLTPRKTKRWQLSAFGSRQVNCYKHKFALGTHWLAFLQKISSVKIFGKKNQIPSCYKKAGCFLLAKEKFNIHYIRKPADIGEDYY
jgi:hypothetical protein